MILFSNDETPLEMPIIGHSNFANSSNITATSENANYPITNAVNQSTNSRWESESAGIQYITATLGSGSLADFVALAGHNFGDSGALLSVECFVDSAWVEVFSSIALETNNPTILKFKAIQCSGIRLKIASSDYTPTITFFYCGKTLGLQRNIYVGHTPLNYGLQSDIINGISENGNFIGRIVIGERHETEISMQNINPSFYRKYIEPFFLDSVENPFFFAWRPATYPNEVGFCWSKNNGSMQNQLSNGMVNISIPLQGVVSGQSIATAQPIQRQITISENVNDLNLRTLYDSLLPTPLDTTQLTVTIESGVTIGSTSTSSAALVIGTWPAGTTILIDHAGTIQGAGGDGGDAPDGQGQDGGPAISTSRAVTIDLANGGSIIDGAGGGAADLTNGGGGGAGSVAGLGGAADGGAAGNVGTTTIGGTASGNAGAGGAAGLIGADSDSADGGSSGCTIGDNPLLTVTNSGSGTIEGCNVNGSDFGSVTIDITTNRTDFNLRTEYDISNATPTAATVVNCYVRNGVTISATSNSNPAFDVGTWPSGATINLFINGSLIPAGGAGGNAPDGAGGAGGDGLLTTTAILIDFADQGSGANGLIAGGGGGGEADTTNGGGGGAGSIVGAGGSADGGSAGDGGTATTGGAAGGSASEVKQTISSSGGNMTLNGGPAAAFDGNTSQTRAQGAMKNYPVEADAHVYADVSASPFAASSFKAFGTTDQGYASDTGSGVTLNVYGKNGSTPSVGSYGTLLGTLSFATGANESTGRDITCSDTVTTFDYFTIEVDQTSGGPSDICLAEFEIYKSVITSDAGAGGDLGQDGADQTSGSGGGAAGNAINGVSLVTKINAGSGTITGPEIN